MLFAGQGTQWVGCGKALYETNQLFRSVLDTIDEQWRQYSPVSLRKACFEGSQAALDECGLAQPVIYMLQCGLLELLKGWGVHPDVVVGHSAGEVAAGYAAGLLSLADATGLVFHRATLQQRTAGSGRMLVVALDRTSLLTLLQELGVCFEGPGAVVELACENSPSSMVLCGTEQALAPVTAALEQRQCWHRLLRGNVAFHSQAMDPLQDALLQRLSFLDALPFEGDVPLVSSVTGLPTQRLDSAYFWTNIRQTVRFHAAMNTVRTQFRPDIVLEVSPHSALTPLAKQCFEGAPKQPTFISTLQRGTDDRLAFHQSLAALFESGVDLAFASHFPRPRPLTHLLPGHPRQEKTVINRLLDDSMFLKRGEYSAGPLLGRRAAGLHACFEVRMSEQDFPWLAEHRVQRLAILPGAAYVELVLEALGGTGVVFEEIEFVKPCPLTAKPVRLRTELVPSDDPSVFTFTISSAAYEGDEEQTLHSQGRLRRVLPDHRLGAAPQSLSDIKVQRFEATRYRTKEAFYEHLSAVLGDYFDYGPTFQIIEQVAIDAQSKELLLDLRMDPAQFEAGKHAGMRLPVPLLDGGLQAFLYFILQTTDYAGIPRRARNLHVVRSPSTPHIVAHFIPTYEQAALRHDKGQFVLAPGEHHSGSVTLYDGATGELVAHLEDYISFQNNHRSDLIRRTRYATAWQPKHATVDPATYTQLATTFDLPEVVQHLNQPPRTLRVVELVSDRPVEQSLAQRLGLDPVHERWLLCKDSATARQHLAAQGEKQGPMHCQVLDLERATPEDLSNGLLRPTAADLLLLGPEALALGPDSWALLQTVAVAGAIAFIACNDALPSATSAPWNDTWTVLRKGDSALLLQARPLLHPPPQATLDSPRWVLGEPGSLAQSWHARLSPDAHLIPWDRVATPASTPLQLQNWPVNDTVRAIDVFVGVDDQDPTGEQLLAILLRFLQQLVAHRRTLPAQPCRMTLHTRHSAFRVSAPRGASLWGAVRSLQLELGSDNTLDLRLIDLGDAGDLDALLHTLYLDPRESELAIRAGKLWSPRLQRQYLAQQTPQAELAQRPYQLVLDQPGQLAGLKMKTVSLPPPGPGEVELDVAAVALNFRDLMVTLGMLPLLSFERSALGRQVGIEASGIVRSRGPGASAFREGDEVVFMRGGSVANRVVVDERLVFHKPKRLSLDQASAVLSVYVTAYYALVHLASLRKGQRVLIHSAMGGVGQAAIALAKHVGADIYVTAGTPAKRQQLQAMGVCGAYDSHSYTWYDDLLRDTGDGVDVVLNSLAGHHLNLCLEAL